MASILKLGSEDLLLGLQASPVVASGRSWLADPVADRQ
jgi:hypothetical protein